MSLRTVSLVAALVMSSICALWLAGFVFLAVNRVNPIGQNNLLTWWQYWRAYSSDATVSGQLYTSMLIAVGLITGLLVALYAQSNKLPLHGESRFANPAEIRAAGLLKSTGIIVGKWGRIFLMFGTQQFVSLKAPTRSGKGVGIVIPNCLNYADSLVAVDVKRENFDITSKYRAENGQEVYCFAPFSTRTHQWNPLSYIAELDPSMRVPEVLSIGVSLYPRTSSGSDTMWNDTARNLFNGLVIYLLETPELPASIGEVLRQASGKGKPLKTHLQELIHARNYDAVTEPDGKGDEQVSYAPKPPYDGTGLPPLSERCVDSLSRFINAPDNTAGGIMTTFTAPLTLWDSPVIDAATTGSDFDLRDVCKRRMSVYVCIPVNKLDQSDVLLQLFFGQFIKQNTDELLGASPNKKHTCLVLLDEFMTLGHVPILAKASGYVADYGLRLLTVVQSHAQVAAPISEGGYGVNGAKALFDNHALSITITPKDPVDARDYSEALGYNTVKSQSRNLRNRWHGTESDQRRALMLPQELERMSQRKQIIRLEGVRPIKCKKIQYYKERVFVDRLKSVSPSLARLRGLPNQAQLKSAIEAGELSAPVPVLDLGLFEAKRNKRTREMTSEDVAGGVNLDAVALDISTIEAPDNVPMTDGQVDQFVNSFWAGLDFPDDDLLLVDTSTGEVASADDIDDPDLVNLKLLEA